MQGNLAMEAAAVNKQAISKSDKLGNYIEFVNGTSSKVVLRRGPLNLQYFSLRRAAMRALGFIVVENLIGSSIQCNFTRTW